MGSKYKRTIKKRVPHETIAVFMEGTVTEPEYLSSLLARLNIPKELVKCFPSDHSDPKGLVDDAVKTKKRSEKNAKKGGVVIDSWWVIVDTECGSSERKRNLSEAIQKARDNNIWLCQSDPSFEYWLLLHYKYSTKSYENSDQCLYDLKKFMPDYKPNYKHPDINTLMGLVEDAVHNASRLRKNYTSFGNKSPRTDCDLLIRKINCQARKELKLTLAGEPQKRELSMHILEE